MPSGEAATELQCGRPRRTDMSNTATSLRGGTTIRTVTEEEISLRINSGNSITTLDPASSTGNGDTSREDNTLP